jgi:hypothetical protein
MLKTSLAKRMASRRYYAKNKRACWDRHMAWCKANPEKSLAIKMKYNKKWLAAHPGYMKEAQRLRYKRCREFLDKLKAAPCMDCGKKYPPCAMDFDHQPTFKKLCAIGQLFNSPRKLLLEELKKCELVCANCHRIRTCKRSKHAH